MKFFILLILMTSAIQAQESDWNTIVGLLDNTDSQQAQETIPAWMYEQSQSTQLNTILENTHSSFKDFTQNINIVLNSTSSFGNEGGHGGDSYGNEFTALAQSIIKELSLKRFMPLLKKSKVNLVDLKHILEQVVVYSGEATRVTLRGQEVDAINFPNDFKILINRTRWRKTNLESKLKLVFHEYLGILDVERDVFNISTHFNRFFDELSFKLKRSQLTAQRYYGQCLSATSLNSIDDPCNIENPRVKKAIICAKERALNNCMAENYHQCVGISLKREVITRGIYGISYCEITSIVK